VGAREEDAVGLLREVVWAAVGLGVAVGLGGCFPELPDLPDATETEDTSSPTPDAEDDTVPADTAEPDVPDTAEPDVPDTAAPDVPDTAEPDVPDTAEPDVPDTSPPDCSTLDDPCNTGAWVSSVGECTRIARTDGTPCDDGDACTVDGTCDGGACVSDPVVCPAPPVTCATLACAPETGTCTLDRSACECVTDPECADGSACSVNTCTDAGTCETDANQLDATACDDGAGTCWDGACLPSGTVRWARRFGGLGSDRGMAIAVDPEGNLVIAGDFSGTAEFGGPSLTSAGHRDFFLASYTPTGDHRWSRRFGQEWHEWPTSIAVAGSGDIVVAGILEFQTDFGAGPLVPSQGGAEFNAFVASFTSTGEHQWSYFIEPCGEDYPPEVRVDGEGNVYIVGNSTADGGMRGYLKSFTPSGQHRWSQSLGAAGSELVPSGLAVDGAGNVFVSGSFQASVTLGGPALSSAGGRDMFLASFTGDGLHRWSRRFGGTGDEWGAKASIDNAGNVTMVGTFRHIVDFGGGELVGPAGGGVAHVVASYTSVGAHRWSRRHPTGALNSYPMVYWLPVDVDGEVYLVGSFGGTGEFGEVTLTSSGSSDAFVSSLSASGSPGWAAQFGGEGSSMEGTGAAPTSEGGLYVVGWFNSSVTAGDVTLVSAGFEDVVLMSLVR